MAADKEKAFGATVFGRGNAGTEGGMILLEYGNRIVYETIKEALGSHRDAKREAATGDGEEKEEAKAKLKYESVNVRICDFDDVEYTIFNDKAAPTAVRVRLDFPAWKDIQAQGKATLERIYGPMLKSCEKEVEVEVDLDTQAPEKDDEVLEKLAQLKVNAIGSVFERYFSAVLSDDKSVQPFSFKLRNDTTVYFVPGDGRVTVIFGLQFTENVDREITRVFLQEFAESRRHLGGAPPVVFSDPASPPLELKQFGVTDPIKDETHVGFVSFSLLKNHLDTKVDPQKLISCVRLMTLFRNYLQYHVKCSKAYFHSRMRARVVSLLKILNRAKTEREEDKEKKTFQGKRFQAKEKL